MPVLAPEARLGITSLELAWCVSNNKFVFLLFHPYFHFYSRNMQSP